MRNIFTKEQGETTSERTSFSPAWIVLLCVVFVQGVSAQNSARAMVDTRGAVNPLNAFNSSVRELVQRVKPSVVQVLVTGYGPVEDSRSSTSLVLGKQVSIGSGVIIASDGYIVTNAHVVTGANRVRITIPAGSEDRSPEQSFITARSRTLDAHLVGADPEIDLALLKVDATGLKALPLADYNQLRQGDVVFAFGSPEGLQDSVTMGVVSAAARQPDSDSSMVYIQSDASINPGSSGGPLVNVAGEVVGINTFIVSKSGGNEGLGFAIPSSVVAFAYPQLLKNGRVHRGQTGIAVQAITPELATGLKLQNDRGVIISDVVPGSPAADAGLAIQDIVTSIDGKPVDNLPSLGTRLFMRTGGERIKLGVLRGAHQLSFDVPVTETPGDFDHVVGLIDPVQGLISKLGIVAVSVGPGTDTSASGLRIPSGVVVAAKAADSKVDVSLQMGDIIHAINGVTVTTLEALRSSLDHMESGSPVVLQVERDGKLTYVTFDLDGDN